MTTCRYECGGLLSPVSHNVGCGLSPFKPLMHAVMHAWTHPSSAGTQEHTSRGAYRTYEPYVKRGAAAGRGSSTASAATCASRLWYCTFESFMSFSSSVRTNSSNTSIDPMKNSRPLPPGLDPRPGQLWVKSHHHQQVSHLGAISRRDATHTLPAVCRAPQLPELRLALLAPLALILGLGGG